VAVKLSRQHNSSSATTEDPGAKADKERCKHCSSTLVQHHSHSRTWGLPHNSLLLLKTLLPADCWSHAVLPGGWLCTLLAVPTSTACTPHSRAPLHFLCREARSLTRALPPMRKETSVMELRSTIWAAEHPLPVQQHGPCGTTLQQVKSPPMLAACPSAPGALATVLHTSLSLHSAHPASGANSATTNNNNFPPRPGQVCGHNVRCQGESSGFPSATSVACKHSRSALVCSLATVTCTSFDRSDPIETWESHHCFGTVRS